MILRQDYFLVDFDTSRLYFLSATSGLEAHMHLFHRHFFEHLSVFAFLFLIFLHEIEDIDGIHV